MKSSLRRVVRGICVVVFCVLVSGSAGRWEGGVGISAAQAGETAGGGAAPLPGLPEAPYVFMGDIAHLNQAGFETVQAYDIGDTAVLNVYNGASARLAGSLGNAMGSMEGVTKLGAGTLSLAAANTYRGTTRLLQGRLALEHNSAAGWGMVHANTGTELEYAPGVRVASAVQALEVDLAATLPASWYTPGIHVVPNTEVHWRVASGQAEHAGLLLGNARVVKQGAGRLNLTGDAAPFTGQWVVNEGALAVNTALPGAVQVNASARLEGVGSVGSFQLASGGVLAPGNSIGTFTVQGDAVFNSGSVFEVEAQPDGQVDSLNVGGTAYLAGTVRTLAANGAWQPETQFTILSAGGGLAGTRFDTVTSNLTFLTPSLSYGANSVFLTLARNDTPLTDPAETPDEEAVAEEIDDGGPGGESPNPDLFDGVVGLDAPTARRAYQQLGGAWLASVQSGLLEDSRFVREAVFEALAQGSCAGALGNVRPVTAMPVSQGGRTCAWARAFHADRSRSGRNGVWGDNRSVQGVFAGAQHRVAPNVWLGGMVGGQFARMDQAGGGAGTNARADTLHFGLNVAWRRNRVSTVAGLAYSRHRVNTGRVVSAGALRDQLTGATSAHTVQVFGEAAWRAWESAWLPAKWGRAKYAVSPFVRLAGVQLRGGGFTEEGGAAALAVSPSRHTVWYSQLGVRGQARIETLTGAALARLTVAWRHAGGNTQVASSQRFKHSRSQAVFTSNGLPVLENALHVALIVAGQVSRTAGLALGYSGVYGAGVQDHGVQLNWREVF
ncbi:autotransporter domain-containing protein [Pusillimonas sp. DMV24BSW_D]|uniref:autotransporter outer membrane beta-barrel domain-containing protein n=1 Tax=Neopusillimonas aestuarii TaxID=2716226 RepID=UPI00140768E7|nr:autotransporter domain-containing protein [Pusillimonas sp. DMV24BSW_D]QIM48039.1 autotransporter domain-containing protein [Pusillimonas sp. DMV24BSW_D]